MAIYQQGAINTTALVVPGLYVQIVPPQNLMLNGVPSNMIGVVGSAQWGPVNTAVIVGTMADYARNFGSLQNRKYDMGTHVATAVQQGANSFRCVRVTDGTDVKATSAIGSQLVFSGAPSLPQSGAGSYATNDTITLAGGTFTTAGVLTVTSTLVQSATINAAGSGGTTGVQTVTGTTGTGTKFQASVTVAGGAITAINSITVPGSYTVNPTTLTAEPVTGGGLTGATLSVKMGVNTVSVSNAGAYTVFPTNPVSQTSTSGAGTGAQFNLVSGGCLALTGIYSGTLGNTLSAAISAGSKSGTWRFTIGLPGYVPEVYDNISGAGNAFWVALASALNNGNSVSRGPSALVTAVAGAGTTAPAAASYTFSGGTDGASGVTPTYLMGNDGLTRTGMYALRGQGCSIGVIADCDTSTAWTTIDGFGLSEGIYFMQVAPAGTAISNGSTGTVDLKSSAGLDSYSTKLLHGDWIWWNDPVNQILRMVSPQGFAAGRLGNLSPEQSGLNKPLYGIAGTQKSGLPGTAATQAYSQAELSALIQAGIDVIVNPSAGGTYWGLAAGHNASSNAAINGDNYTRMTNYIASTLNAGMGKYVGQVVNITLFQRIRSTLMSFFANLLQQGLLGTTDGSLPYGVICDISNNPNSRTGLGYVQADCQVRYQAINEKFIVNVEGGQTVNVIKQSTTVGTI